MPSRFEPLCRKQPNKHFQMLKKLAIPFLLLTYCCVGRAQDLRVQSITVADGLSQGFVSCLFQDSRGFMWIGTFNGLNRYDGYQIKRFDQDNTLPWSLKSNFINCITEDRHGLLWLGTDKGLVVYDPHSDRFVHLAETVTALPGADVGRIITCSDGRVWVNHQQPGTSGVLLVRPPDNLAGMIRNGRLGDHAFQVLHVSLGADVNGPLVNLQMLQDSILIAGDAQNRHCRINPETRSAERSDPRTLPHRRFGNYRLVYWINGKQGAVFLPEETQHNQPDNLQNWSEFVQMPGGEILLLRIGTTVLHRMDTLGSRRETPGFDQMSFYRQFPSFFELDILPTQAATIDHSGNLWVGTSGFGVRKISRGKLDFKRYLPQYSFYNFRFLPDGRVWPGSPYPHHVSNLKTGQLEPAPWTTTLSKKYFPYSILITKGGDWWTAALRQRELVLLKKDHTTNRWTEWPVSLHWLRDVQVQLFEDSRGAIWLAGNRGNIVRIPPKEGPPDTWDIGPYFPQNRTDQLRSTALVEDRAGNLWIGSNNGLIQVTNPEAKPTFRVWQNDDNNPALFKTDWILSICPDPKILDVLWIGLRGGGLARFDARTQTTKHFTTKDGLANNVVYGILPDSSGYFWLSTNQGLSRFDLRNQTFYNYNKVEPAIDIEFNTGGHGYTPSGDLAFGGIEGLFVVRPNAAQQTTPSFEVVVTDIAVNGQNLNFSRNDLPLRINPDNTLSLHLPHDRNNLVISFAAPDAGDPAIVQYRYRLLPLAQNWVSTGFQRTANFVGIPPGRYTFELQAKNSNDDWSSARTTRMYLTVRPPWYRSLWAYACYAFLAILIFRFYLRMVRKRITLEQEMALNQQKMEQLKTLDTFKNRFFAYVSHEFKTPLTIIIGLAERLRKEGKTTKTADNIAQQGQALLELVDQVVDIARLEDHTLRLNSGMGNFSQYIRFMAESCRPLAEFGKVELEVFTPKQPVIMDFDPIRLRYIVGNLLSNAIRHTPPGGSVQVRVLEAGADAVRLEIADTGSGISPDDLPHIFERYYRGKHEATAYTSQHFGLGLAYVKDLVQLFKGTISVTSTPGQGTVFSITLPVSRNAPPMAPAPHLLPNTPLPLSSEHKPPARKSLPQLLVVEDNPVIADYLHSCLHPHFRLILATSGNQGLELALEHIPDLILSDVMMPGMDGLELTRRLKTHALTNHIPVVLLSARSELEARLSGQQQGADAYLGKPFHEQELLLILNNLHSLQQRWKERYAGASGPKIPSDSENRPPHPADVFMENLYALFEKNCDNDEYDLPQLCRDMEVSKSQLQRKLAAVSDQSAMDLLRRYRLQKAQELLWNNPGLSVKEAGFRVGFKDPTHFSRTFAKVMGFPPSEVRSRKTKH